MGWADAPVIDDPNGGVAKWQQAPEASDSDWARQTLLPTEHNRRTGEWRLAVPGALQSVWDAVTLPGEVAANPEMMDPRVPYSQTDPKTLDRAAALAAIPAAELPMVSRNMVAAGAHEIIDASGKRLPGLVATELANANLDPAAVRAGLAKLGPDAVIGDLTPRLQARTGAVATMPGPGQDIIVNQLTKRALAANSRIKQGVGEIFGPEPVPSRVAGEIDVARKAANEAYPPVFAEKALSGRTPAEAAYDAAPLAKAINDAVPTFVGETRNKVASVGKMLIDPATGELTKDPQVILAVRSELDGMIGEMKDQQGSKTTVAALGDLRKMIDGDLAQQVPGVKWADAGAAAAHAQQEGFDLGRQALKNGTGDTIVHPVDFKDKLTELSGPQGTAIGPRQTPSIAPQRVSEGMLSQIYQTIGVTANDRVALKQLLKGDGSWNREKMDAAFGSDKAEKFIAILDSEAQKAGTENLALSGSKTEVLRSGKEGIEPVKVAPGVIRSAGNLQFGDAALAAADKLLGGTLRRNAAAKNAKVARALMSGAGDLRIGASGAGVGAKVLNQAVLQVLMDKAKRGGVMNFGGGGGGY